MWPFGPFTLLRICQPFLVAGGALAAIVTGTGSAIWNLGVIAASILVIAWFWERVREYNRSDRYRSRDHAAVA
jgi:hypothetical protein